MIWKFVRRNSSVSMTWESTPRRPTTQSASTADILSFSSSALKSSWVRPAIASRGTPAPSLGFFLRGLYLTFLRRSMFSMSLSPGTSAVMPSSIQL